MNGDEQRRQPAEAKPVRKPVKHMTSEQYNGWTNRETWLVNLWMHENQSEVRHFTEQAKTLIPSELAECLEDYYSEVLPQMPGVYADLLAGALANVNWRELAKQLAEDASYDNAKAFGDYRSAEEMAAHYGKANA